MGGDDSQKLLPWRGIHSSPGRSKPPARCKINTLTQRPSAPARLSYYLEIVVVPRSPIRSA
jgi:hypothetical protein